MGRFLTKKYSAAVLAALLGVTCGQDNISSTASGPAWNHAYFETSPPVYPSPNATGIDWDGAFQQASNFVAQLTLAEKAQLVTGTTGPCVGNIGPVYRLGFNGLCLQDGPLAIREATYASVFPAGLSVAASWDRSLAKQRGSDIGAEFKGKGAHVALGPVAGPLGRSGYGGRNWEGFSPDPYLTGKLFADTVEGIQSSGVQASSKHYIGNEQETQRNPSISKNEAVKAGTASIMCSYNRLNGSYACQNSKSLNGLLKTELGFQGYVVSDWGGTHSGYPAIEAGQDMDMPGSLSFVAGSTNSYFGSNITIAVNNGTLSEDRVDDMVRRVMTPYFALGQDSGYPPIDGSSYGLNSVDPPKALYNFTLGASNVDIRDDHADLIRELGAAGIVLLKNTKGTLPLKAPKNIGVFGDDFGDLTDGLYSIGSGALGYEYGVLPVGGGSGTGRFSYVVPPIEAIKAQAKQQGNNALVQYVQNNTLITNGGGFDIVYPTRPDVCLVFSKTWATEGYDRTSLLLDWNGTGVVETVAASCSNTIVVTNSGGLNVLPFADHPNVTAILAAHYPGQEVGNSIVDVLWGATNPSGKLPYTIALNEEGYSFAGITNSTTLQNTNDPNAWQSDFEERLLIDYHWFDYMNETVQYEFGYGLSYTSFALSDLSISKTTGGIISALPANGTIKPGGLPSLWAVLYTATTTIQNTGSVAGAAVPQLYLGIPAPAEFDNTPVRVLRGFDKIFLQPGESKTVTFDLTRKDISYWDIYNQQWTIDSGAVKVYAGFSSRDIKATGSFTPLA